MARRVALQSYQRRESDNATTHAIQEHLQDIDERVGEGPFLLQGYSVGALPDATKWGSSAAATAFSSLIFIYNETGGATLAFSNGTNWLRVQDRAIVS